MKADSIIAAAGSRASISRLASATDRPERAICTHFIKPVETMNAVELIRGIATGEATFQAIQNFITNVGKAVVLSEDFPPFIIDRVLMAMINEAIYALHDAWGQITRRDRYSLPNSSASTVVCRA